MALVEKSMDYNVMHNKNCQPHGGAIEKTNVFEWLN